MARDPVCGMDVDETASTLKVEHGGQAHRARRFVVRIARPRVRDVGGRGWRSGRRGRPGRKEFSVLLGVLPPAVRGGA